MSVDLIQKWELGKEVAQELKTQMGMPAVLALQVCCHTVRQSKQLYRHQLENAPRHTRRNETKPLYGVLSQE